MAKFNKKIHTYFGYIVQIQSTAELDDETIQLAEDLAKDELYRRFESNLVPDWSIYYDRNDARDILLNPDILSMMIWYDKAYAETINGLAENQKAIIEQHRAITSNKITAKI